MSEYKNRRKILSCLTIAVSYVLVAKISGVALKNLAAVYNIPYPELIPKIICAIFAILIMGYLHRQSVLKGTLESFWKGIATGGFLGVYLLLMIILFFISDFSAGQLIESSRALVFIFSMFLTGFSEEIIFRGVILNTLRESFKKESRTTIYKVVIFSSLIFAVMHLSNIFSGVPFSAAVIQMAGAFGVGCYFAAIYMRCNTIWVTIVYHAMMNFVSLMGTELMGEGDAVSTISGYGPERLMGLILYLGLTVYLLRKTKMQEMIH